MKTGVLLVAHGTVQNLDDLGAFLSRIRHGRPTPPELVQEVRRRYERVGPSPLLDVTREQARLLSLRLGMPTFVGMRLWDPSVETALSEAGEAGIERLVLVPLAPFSVHVYAAAAERSRQTIAAALTEKGKRVPALVVADAWGSHPAFVRAHAALIGNHAPENAALILTAHSLPLRAIASGDPYATLINESADAVRAQSGRGATLAYQSQGLDGGEWLGPDLRSALQTLATQGAKAVAVDPFGFLSEHVETLYDLDVEAQAWARELNLEWARVPAIGTHGGLIEAMADVALRALAR